MPRQASRITDLTAIPAGVMVLLYVLPKLIFIKVILALNAKVVIWTLFVVRLEVVFRFEDL